MSNPFRLRQKTQTIANHRLPEPRLTFMALVWVLVYVGLPLMAASTLLDLLIQQLTGSCTGFWCWF